MGTMSFGSRGSGSGMRTGNGGGGGYESSDGQMRNKSFSPDEIKAEVVKLLKKLFSHATPYMGEMFNNQYLNNIYSELFEFSSLLKNQNSVELISERYNLAMHEPLFIFNLIKRIEEKFKQIKVDDWCVTTVRIALERFLEESVKDDPNIILANGRDVVKAMGENSIFWKSISGYFLFFIAITVYKKDVESKIQNASFMVQKEIEQRTNHVIESYIQIQIDKGQKVDYKNIFRYIGLNWDWFNKEMMR